LIDSTLLSVDACVDILAVAATRLWAEATGG